MNLAEQTIQILDSELSQAESTIKQLRHTQQLILRESVSSDILIEELMNKAGWSGSFADFVGSFERHYVPAEVA